MDEALVAQQTPTGAQQAAEQMRLAFQVVMEVAAYSCHEDCCCWPKATDVC